MEKEGLTSPELKVPVECLIDWILFHRHMNLMSDGIKLQTWQKKIKMPKLQS